MNCRHCHSEDLRPMTIKPPRKPSRDKHICTPKCSEHGFLCRNCRMFQATES